MEITNIAHLQSLVVSGFNDWDKLGHVKVTRKDNLLLFNYTSEATFADRWNYFEYISRGLIIDRYTGEIVARPFDKFFNWFEKGRKGTGHIVNVTLKQDGSLGILYRHDGQFKIATRGSFDSEQAIWATNWFNEKFGKAEFIPDNLTLLFEIIYKENRIVIDYGDFEGLVLLAVRDRETGQYWPHFPNLYSFAARYGFNLVPTAQFNNIAAIIEATGQIGPEQEGWVVEMSDGSRWKFKGDQYVELHKLIHQLSFKQMLSAVQDGTYQEKLLMIPDYLLPTANEWVRDIRRTVANTKRSVTNAYKKAPKHPRKEFALWVNENVPELAPYMFRKLDGKDFDDLIYKREF